MSIKFTDDLTFDIYVKKQVIEDVDFNDRESLEKYLKKLFKTLKNKYNITVEGFYDITVYIDKYYGVIFHLEKEDLDYYDFYKNQVDMRIITIDTEFMYKVDDIPLNLLDKINIFAINNEIYIKIKDDLTNLEMMELVENVRSFESKAFTAIFKDMGI